MEGHDGRSAPLWFASSRSLSGERPGESNHASNVCIDDEFALLTYVDHIYALGVWLSAVSGL